MGTIEHTRKWFDTNRDRLYKNFKIKACGNCESPENLHIHHIVPLALGGTNNSGNLVLLCESCHSKIHGKGVLNKELQRAGIEKAKASGKHLGRPVMTLPKEWGKLYKDWKAGTIKAVEFMDAVGMKKATFYNKVKQYEATL